MTLEGTVLFVQIHQQIGDQNLLLCLVHSPNRGPGGETPALKIFWRGTLESISLGSGDSDKT